LRVGLKFLAAVAASKKMGKKVQKIVVFGG
jgi:hypothetical protein